MPRKRDLRIAGLAVLLLAGSALASAQDAQPPVEVNSFSGAFLAGRSAEIDNDLNLAARYYERALDFAPGNKDIEQSLLLSLISNGKIAEALPYAEKLKEVPEVERFSRLVLAVQDFKAGDYQKAEYWLKLTLESDLDQMITGLMTAWARYGKDGAQAGLDQLQELRGPEWSQLFVTYHRALMADLAGRKDVADEAFRQTVDNLPGGGAAPQTWLRAAEAYAGFLTREGKKDEANKILDRIAELYTGRPSTDTIRDQITRGDVPDRTVKDPLAGAAETLVNVGSALNRGGGEAFVRIYLQLALHLQPDNDAALFEMALASEQMRKHADAVAFYERINENSPLKRIARLQEALNLADMEEKERAISELQKVIQASPKDLQAYLAIGSIYASDKNFAEAAKIYEKAVSAIGEPKAEDWNLFFQRGIAYERLKQWDKAEPNFHQALKLSPDHPQVLNYLGYSWIDKNMNLKEGMELIRKAVDLRPSDGYIVDSLGWAYYKLGQYDDAVRELERAVSLMPEDPTLNDHLGDAYWKVGRRLEARFQWSHARDLEPEPELLEQVEKKLKEGMPAEESKPEEPQRVEAEPAPEPVETAQASTPETPAPVAQPVSATTAPVVDASDYEVQPGQSLWSIADERLGDGNRYRDILQLNPVLKGDPNRIVPGQRLVMPPAN
ncbi:tetratricopeptide repeat protein [Limoniibacter endophyticus]|uniref:LysM domain-containing protein n=1 Tax=Limoniibacter endophyticus TaxID=1565040 RepID=A0A8J3GHJ9_9HYPH|nr:tetratricopeptide repeat protein [Limoniibacter endophyticus]GHC71357.1 hypothetical protein GCM10010136_18460 [Limoniibacter endophyticus]